jgi:hypothetical protein
MARISRRQLLLGGAGLAAGGAAAAGFGLSLGSPAEGFRVLSRGEVAVVRAAAMAMFPGAPFPVNGLEAKVAEGVDAFLADVLDGLRGAGFRYVLRTLEWGTLASRGSRFSELDLPTRQLVLDTWAEPEVFTRRVAGDSVKVVLGTAYFANDQVLDHMEWDGGCSRRGA